MTRHLDKGPVAQLAAALTDAHRTGSPITEIGDERLITTEADAYEVQKAQLPDMGCIIGWKVGRKSPAAPPACAPLFDRKLHRSGATLDRHAFHHWLIEAEIVFRFGRDLPSAGRPYDRQAVVDAIDQVCAGFEIVDSRFAAWPDVSAPLILADFASHGAMVIGSGTAPPAALSFGEAPVRLVIDDAVIVDRQGGNPAGDIVELAVWLANHLAETGAGLRAGDYVTTGSYTGMAPVPPGKAAEAHFATIGSVSVNRA